MELAEFKKKCKSISTRGTTLTKDINELVQDAIEAAKKHGDFNRASLCLEAMWAGRLYSPAKIVVEYFKAHGPFEIKHDKKEGSFKVKLDKSETAIKFVEKRVPYYSWEKPKVEAALTLDNAKKRFEMLMKDAHEKLTKEEQIEFDKMVVARAKRLEVVVDNTASDEDIQAPQAEAA
jgi:hypothetical protein